MRYFEGISFEQFKKDISDEKKLYNGYWLPRRSIIGFKYNVRMCN